MREQVRIVSQADIIIYVHGAAMGNFPFLSPVRNHHPGHTCQCPSSAICRLLHISAVLLAALRLRMYSIPAFSHPWPRQSKLADTPAAGAAQQRAVHCLAA